MNIPSMTVLLLFWKCKCLFVVVDGALGSPFPLVDTVIFSICFHTYVLRQKRKVHHWSNNHPVWRFFRSFSVFVRSIDNSDEVIYRDIKFWPQYCWLMDYQFLIETHICAFWYTSSSVGQAYLLEGLIQAIKSFLIIPNFDPGLIDWWFYIVILINKSVYFDMNVMSIWRTTFYYNIKCLLLNILCALARLFKGTPLLPLRLDFFGI